MTESYSLQKDDSQNIPTGKRRVFVTGAGGRIGSFFAEKYHECYDLTLMIRPGSKSPELLEQWGEQVECDLDDRPRLTRLLEGRDTVLHLAADSAPEAEWADLLPANIVGTYNTFKAACDAGCRRVIFASSIHAVSGYPPGFQVHDHDPVNPGDLYGVTKCFGEAMGRYMAERNGLSVIALRIGAFLPLASARDPAETELIDAFVSRRDLGQLIQRCIDDTKLRFAVFHALSNNRFNRMDISGAEELVGYAPEDDFAAENPALKGLPPRQNTV